MLSGTESNRGTKCIPRVAKFNPRLALIGFLGTRACIFTFHLLLVAGWKALQYAK